MHVGAVSLELFENLEGRRDVDFILTVLSDPVGECDAELESNLPLGCLREVPWLLVSEEVEIGLILLELLSDNIKLISQLIVLLSNLEEVIPANRLNYTDCPSLELLQKLCVIAHETVGTEAGTLRI